MTKTTIYDRPEMESPVYKVEAEGKEFFIQRQESNDYSAWYQVEYDGQSWICVGDQSDLFAGFLGFTKQEAIEILTK